MEPDVMLCTLLLALLGCCIPLGNTRSLPPGKNTQGSVKIEVPGAPPALGPRGDETGRFLYTEDSTGRIRYCMFCPLEAVRDSTFAFMQQPNCYEHSNGSDWNNVLTPYERLNEKYPICNEIESGDKKSETPGCREPPDFGVAESVWVCSKGYNNDDYSVYSSCQLACSVGKNMLAEIYCNESLVWHTVSSTLNSTLNNTDAALCKAPTTEPAPTTTPEPTTKPNPVAVKETQGLSLWKWICIAIGSALVVVIIGIIVFFCIRRRKRSPSQQSSSETINLDRLLPPPGQGATPAPTNAPRWNGSASTIGRCSIPDEPTEDMATPYDPEVVDVDDLVQESSRLLPEEPEDSSKSSRNSDKCCSAVIPRDDIPDVKVFHSNMRDSIQENLESSCRIQENAYSVPRGSTFYIVPSSPHGIEIKEFVVLRKGGGGVYRGVPCPELNLDFFHTIQNTDYQDAGDFTWHITLMNGQHFQRNFQIFVSRGDEAHDDSRHNSSNNSIQSPLSDNGGGDNDDGINDNDSGVVDENDINDVNENHVEFDSGEKSEQAEGPVGPVPLVRPDPRMRPEPLGAEDEPKIQSGGPKPQIPPAPASSAPLAQDQHQNAVPLSINIRADTNLSCYQPNSLNRTTTPGGSGSSLSHPNILSSSLPNSRQPDMGRDEDEHPNVEARDNRGVGLSRSQDSPVNLARLQELRGELASSSASSNNSRNDYHLMPLNMRPADEAISGLVQQPSGPDHLNVNSLYSANSPAVSGAQSLLSEPVIGGILDDVSRLAFNSMMREEPSGISREIQHVENPRPEMAMSSDFNNDYDDVEVANDEEYNERHQTYRKVPAEVPQCTARLSDLTDLHYVDRLCNLADPKDLYGRLKSWFGFGINFGIPVHKLQAIEYHRRGFVHDGPMKFVLHELEGRYRACHLVQYFMNNDRWDIVNLTIDECPDHRNCDYCIRLRTQHGSR